MATKTHKVVKGDTLYKIAKQYGTTIDAIKNANPDKIKNVHVLSIGWVLKIPVPNGSDTSETIRKQFKTTLNDVQTLPSVKKLFELLEG